MDITFIVPAFNEEALIGGCLNSIAVHATGTFKEIVVVDNGSTDKTADIATRYGARVVREDRKGSSYARQKGFESSHSNLLAYIDADSMLDSGWVSTARRLIATYPDAVCWSGPAKYHDGSIVQRAIMWGVWNISAPIAYRIVGYMVFGANFIVRRNALVDLGGFDLSVPFYGDDTTLARQLASRGRTIFDMSFYINTSARRFAHEGILRTNFQYALNFLWPVLFHRPFTKSHNDIR